MAELTARTRSPGARVTDTPECYAREPVGTQPDLDHPPYKSTALRHPKRPLVYMPHTLTEVTGPQLAGLVGEDDNNLLVQHAGEPVPDALVETWQADSRGRFADLHRRGGASELETTMTAPSRPRRRPR